MARSFSVSKNQLTVFITLIVLILLGAAYFFIYVPSNERIVQQRHFLSLQNIEQNINLKIDNSLAQLKGLDTAYNNGQQQAVIKYIDNYPKKDFTLLKIQPNPKEWKDKDSSFIDVGISSKLLTLYLTQKIDNNAPIKIGIQYKIEQFIKPLLPPGDFENYVVFYTGINGTKTNSATNNNKILYETFPSGLNYITIDSLLEKNSGLKSPGIRNLNINGTGYKIFSQPIAIDNNKEWVVAGLVSFKNYQKEKNELPLPIVLFLLTAAVGTIVSLPWIKLYHMGGKDKLSVTDGMSTIMVAMLLMSLLFITVFKYSFNFGQSANRFISCTNTLANSITKAFEKDLDVAYKLLCRFDDLNKTLHDNIVNLGTDAAKHEQKGSFNTLPDEYHFLKHPFSPNVEVHQVFWIDEGGLEKDAWISDSVNSPHTNTRFREYFKNTVNDRPNKAGKPAYYVDQVVSRTSGVFTSIIAKKSVSPGRKVAAISFTAKSLDTVIMPDGYQFAIIDNTGKVLYHSKAERNLNEYLTKEFADSSKLVSCLQAKSDASFDAQYYGNQYHIKIKPFTDLPYFIVIFEDLEYNNARDTEPYAFTVCMLICLVGFLTIQFTTVFILSSKKSFFKKQHFATSWIGPKTNFHVQYNVAIICNTIIIIMMMCFFSNSSFLEYIYILLFSITCTGICLNGIFAITYKKGYNFSYRFKKTALIVLSVFVLLIDLAAGYTLESDHFMELIQYELILMFIFIALYFFYLHLLKNTPGSKNKFFSSNSHWTYTHSFALMATTRLIITSGMPVAFFFIYSFNYEQSLETRYRQLNFAENLTQNFPVTNPHYARFYDSINGPLKIHGVYSDALFVRNIKPYPLPVIIPYSIEDFLKNSFTLKNNGVYSDSLFIKNKGRGVYFCSLLVDSSKTHLLPEIAPYSIEDSITVEILSNFRLYHNSIAIKSNNLNLPVAGTVIFNNITNVNASRDFTATYYNTGSNGYLKVTSGKISYPPISLFFWILLIGLIGAFYLIIHKIIRKLFAIDLPSIEGWWRMDKQLLMKKNLNGALLILGPPGSDKLNKLKKNIALGNINGFAETPLVLNEKEPSKNNFFIVDMIMISAEKLENDPNWIDHREKALENHPLVIINHFDYNIKDAKTNSIKLDFLETLLQKGKSKVIIISSVHPITFLDSFNEQQSMEASAEQQANRISESEFERWKVVLGLFRIVIEPLVLIHRNHRKAPIPDRAIIRETQYSKYLNNMQQMTLDTLPYVHNKGNDFVGDSLIFKLQITSHYFYNEIWQSLTKEEKFLLYDLAEDGLVNSFDDYNLSMLVCKGLIIRPHGTLMLFNKGFRNFILTSIGTAEVNRIKQQVRDNGRWGNMKAPLSLAVVAILVFLITSQQESYTQIITYVTALGAGVPAVLKLFAMFGGSTAQKTA